MIYEAIDRWNDPNTYLEHHGVKGMKWGVRKAYHNFQGRRLRRSANKIQEDINSLKNARNKNGMSEKDTNKSVAALEKIRDKQLNKAEQHENYQPKSLTNFGKKSVQFIKDHKKEIAIGAAVVAGTALAAYGAYKVHSIRQQNMAAVGEYLKSHNVRLGEGKLMSTATYGGNSHMQEFTRQSSSIKKSILGPTLNTNIHTTTRWRSPTIDNHGNWTWNKYKTTINSLDKTTTIGRGGSKYRDDLFLKSKNKYMRRAGKLSMKKNANYYKDFMSMYK